MIHPIRWLCRVHDALTDAGYIIGVIGLSSMAILYCYEVLTRYFLDVATDWANDIFSNILCITIFALAPHTTRAGLHISINLIVEINPNLRKAQNYFSGVLGFIICLLAAWMSLDENIRQVAFGVVTDQNHPIPKVWISSFITYGFFGSAFYFLRSLFTARFVRPVSWVVPNQENNKEVN